MWISIWKSYHVISIWISMYIQGSPQYPEDILNPVSSCRHYPHRYPFGYIFLDIYVYLLPPPPPPPPHHTLLEPPLFAGIIQSDPAAGCRLARQQGRQVAPAGCLLLAATCDEWENDKSISSVDTGHASIEHGAKADSDLARRCPHSERSAQRAICGDARALEPQ